MDLEVGNLGFGRLDALEIDIFGTVGSLISFHWRLTAVCTGPMAENVVSPVSSTFFRLLYHA